MEGASRVELASGLFASAAGLLGLGYALFGPVYSNGYGTASMLQLGLHATAVPFLTALFLSTVGAAGGAYLHGRHGLGLGQVLSWLSAAVLVVGAVFSLGIGLLVLPAALLATIAAAAGTVPPGSATGEQRG